MNSNGHHPKNSPEKKGKEPHKSRSDYKGGDIFAFAKSNKELAIAYGLLALGLLLLLFFYNLHLLGGLLIGIVAGYVFSDEIIQYIRNIGQIAGGQNQLRYVTLTSVLLGLLIAAPGIFIGALVVAILKTVIFGQQGV
jgi:hypothetical protein